MKKFLIPLLLLFFALALFKPTPAEAKTRDGVMIAVGVISFTLIAALVYSAVSGKAEKKEKKTTDQARPAGTNDFAEAVSRKQHNPEPDFSLIAQGPYRHSRICARGRLQ